MFLFYSSVKLQKTEGGKLKKESEEKQKGAPLYCRCKDGAFKRKLSLFQRTHQENCWINSKTFTFQQNISKDTPRKLMDQLKRYSFYKSITNFRGNTKK